MRFYFKTTKNYNSLAKKTLSLSLLTLGLLLNACSNGTAAEKNSQNKGAQSPSTQTTKPSTAPISNDPITKNLQANINKAGLSAQVVSVTPTDIPELYLATISGMPPVFTDKNGSYIIQGDIIKLDAPPYSISDKAQATLAKEALAKVDKSQMIIFSPKSTPKAAIYVFSDPTCHYCQLLHKDIQKINDLGIEVRYLAWPRSEEMISLTESIWCNSNRHQALTDAKAGKMPKPATCSNPVQEHIALGFSLGVSGTPAVFSESGVQLGGYLPPDELAAAAISTKQ